LLGWCERNLSPSQAVMDIQLSFKSNTIIPSTSPEQKLMCQKSVGWGMAGHFKHTWDDCGSWVADRFTLLWTTRSSRLGSVVRVEDECSVGGSTKFAYLQIVNYCKLLQSVTFFHQDTLWLTTREGKWRTKPLGKRPFWCLISQFPHINFNTRIQIAWMMCICIYSIYIYTQDCIDKAYLSS
jgi:hypothetical protein